MSLIQLESRPRAPAPAAANALLKRDAARKMPQIALASRPGRALGGSTRVMLALAGMDPAHAIEANIRS